MKKLLLFLTLVFAGFTASYAQGTVTGQLIAVDENQPLSGANVTEDGATTNGTASDFDGNFSVSVSKNSGSIRISYIGFISRVVNYTLVDGKADLGKINITTDDNSLEEVVIIGSGVIDLAESRQTPIAVSTITAKEIQLKAAGNVEFTEAFKNVPSVYVANQVGGFGDSQVFLRGFDDSNTAFLLNGQPINSPEDGRMFWSNWSGMADVANGIQVQRGLGSSKLAISSVGGTVNIISKATDQRQGGWVRFLTGNDSYFKGTASYNTGLNDKGWGFSFLVDHWQGHRKWARGTAGQGQNYMFSVGYKPNETHSFNFLITGAPQWHDQNFSSSLDNYEEFGRRYNPNTGFLDGERFTERRNFYHKPVMNLNWDYEISDNTELSTVLYASWGRGGGTGRLSGGGNTVRSARTGEIDFNQIFENNTAVAAANNGIGNFGNAYVLRSSVNAHNWYGLLSNIEHEFNDNLSISGGFDVRTYNGIHFRQLNNLLGLSGYNDNFRTDRPDDYVVTEEFEADPWDALFNRADNDQRVVYNYEEQINYQGVFGQIEYATDRGSIFFQGAASNQSYQREGFFVGRGDGLGKSEAINKLGYNAKGGASFKINDENTIFANAGYYSRQPYLDNVFSDIRYSNAVTDPEIDNEEITGLEAGYRFQNNNLRINFDAYHTIWGNRFVAIGGIENAGTEEEFFTNIRLTDVTQIHNGVEMDFEYRPDAGTWRLRGFASVGNWKYDGETPFTVQNDETGEFIPQETDVVDISGIKVGPNAQTSAGFGFSWDATEQLSFDVDGSVFENIFQFVDVEDVAEAAVNDEEYVTGKVGSYGLLDAGLTYRFYLGDNKVTFRGNVFNLTNREYINQVGQFGTSLGQGRTYNVSLRYNF